MSFPRLNNLSEKLKNVFLNDRENLPLLVKLFQFIADPDPKERKNDSSNEILTPAQKEKIRQLNRYSPNLYNILWDAFKEKFKPKHPVFELIPLFFRIAISLDYIDAHEKLNGNFQYVLDEKENNVREATEKNCQIHQFIDQLPDTLFKFQQKCEAAFVDSDENFLDDSYKEYKRLKDAFYNANAYYTERLPHKTFPFEPQELKSLHAIQNAFISETPDTLKTELKNITNTLNPLHNSWWPATNKKDWKLLEETVRKDFDEWSRPITNEQKQDNIAARVRLIKENRATAVNKDETRIQTIGSQQERLIRQETELDKFYADFSTRFKAHLKKAAVKKVLPEEKSALKRPLISSRSRVDSKESPSTTGATGYSILGSVLLAGGTAIAWFLTGPVGWGVGAGVALLGLCSLTKACYNACCKKPTPPPPKVITLRARRIPLHSGNNTAAIHRQAKMQVGQTRQATSSLELSEYKPLISPSTKTPQPQRVIPLSAGLRI